MPRRVRCHAERAHLRACCPCACQPCLQHEHANSAELCYRVGGGSGGNISVGCTSSTALPCSGVWVCDSPCGGERATVARSTSARCCRPGSIAACLRSQQLPLALETPATNFWAQRQTALIDCARLPFSLGPWSVWSAARTSRTSVCAAMPHGRAARCALPSSVPTCHYSIPRRLMRASAVAQHPPLRADPPAALEAPRRGT